MQDTKKTQRTAKIVGYDKVRKEIKELGSMLCNIDKYKALGVRIPRGLVLYGEPGVGKSTFAKSIATGKTHVVELRAAEYGDDSEEKICEAFQFAKEHTPCVIVLDELDKVAERSMFGERNEKAQILMQQLDELSGADEVFVVATCNSLSGLDDALLRSGRFDRQIHVQNPDEATRKKILKHYFSKIAIDCLADLDYAAKITYGMSCADLECIANEAGILAINQKHNQITIDDVRFVINKMAFDGVPEKVLKDAEISHRVAVHEAGHALVALMLLPDQIHGASIVPQGGSLGHVDFVGEEKGLRSIQDMKAEIAIALAGHVAEREILGNISTGAENDIQRAMSLSIHLITGCADRGYKFVLKRFMRFDNAELSEQTKYELENEVNALMEQADAYAADLIRQNKKALDRIVDLLAEKKILSRKELLDICKKCA